MAFETYKGKTLVQMKILANQQSLDIERLSAALLKFVEHFGPLEDNHMLHDDARSCFRLARKALGPEQHDVAIKRALAGE
jgi:hypothetical protein